MNKRFRVIVFLIAGSFVFWTSASWGAGDFTASAAENGVFQSPYDALESASEYYQRSGLGAGYEISSMLWSETLKRRNDLQKKLPLTDEDLVRKFRAELEKALNEDANNADALILAGRYQLTKGQYDGALWNFQKALSVEPDSIDVRNALADYYLTRWQPEPVISLLRGNQNPEALFRLGEAYLQKNDYFSALGCLLQAEPLSGKYGDTRNKDIAKAFLGIGEIALAKQFIQEDLTAEDRNPVRETLSNEMQGWIAWMEGNALQASYYWTQGKAANPDYLFWDSLNEWVHPTVLPPTQTSGYLPSPKGDSELNSQFNIARGLNMVHDNKNDVAYSCFLAGIKADHRSLIGFLGAARSQLMNKKYLSAADLCSQGLAVNPNFRPLLELKLGADAKLGKKDEVLKDRELLRKMNAASASSMKISGNLDQTPTGKPILQLQGETKSLYGVWISPDGLEWQFQPWWGEPVYLKGAASQLWVLPSGKDLSGEVLFVRNSVASARTAVEKPLLTINNGFSVAFSSKVEIIAGFFGNGHLSGPYLTENGNQKHGIPFSNASRNSNELAVWFRTSDRKIGVARFSITAPLQERVFKYRLNPEKTITNRRNIRLNLSWDGDSAIADKIAVSEGSPTEPAVWQSAGRVIPFTVSEGDGVKEITVKLSDRDGNSAELKTEVLLDTLVPQFVDVKVDKKNSGNYGVQWTANKQCKAWIEALTSQGVWQKTAAPTNDDQSFTGMIPGNTSYCAVILIDRAGNRNEIPLTTINDELQKEQPAKFMINDGAGFVNSRNVEIRPVGDLSAGWSVSNDLRTWAPIILGSNVLRWRLGPGEGEKRVFFRVVDGGNRKNDKIFSIPIVLDTTPPVIKNLSVNKTGDGYLIQAEFSEPVCLSAMGNTSPKDSTYRTYQEWGIKSHECSTNTGFKISVKDRAGNRMDFQPDFASASDSDSDSNSATK